MHRESTRAFAVLLLAGAILSAAAWEVRAQAISPATTSLDASPAVDHRAWSFDDDRSDEPVDGLPSKLSAETRQLMQRLEMWSNAQTLRLRLSGAGAAGVPTLPSGTYQARHLFFSADSVYWLAPGPSPARRQAPLWRLERVTTQDRKKGAQIGSAFGSLLGLAAGAAVIQFVGYTNDRGASIGPALSAIPIGTALGLLTGYTRGRRRRYTFDDLPSSPQPPPPMPPESTRRSLAELKDGVQQLREARSMMVDRTSELEQALWELEHQHDSLRTRVQRLERRLEAATARLAVREKRPAPPTPKPQPAPRPVQADVANDLAPVPPAGEAPAYGIVVASLPQHEDALAASRRIEELLLRRGDRYSTTIVPAEDQNTFRAVFGPFKSMADAQRTIAALNDVLPDDAWIVRLR